MCNQRGTWLELFCAKGRKQCENLLSGEVSILQCGLQWGGLKNEVVNI